MNHSFQLRSLYIKECEKQHGGFCLLYKQHVYGNCLLSISKRRQPQQHSTGCFCGYILHEDGLIVGNKSLNDC